MNIVTSVVTSPRVLYLAKSGVKTPISSPPLDIVTAATVRKDKYALLLICAMLHD